MIVTMMKEGEVPVDMMISGALLLYGGLTCVGLVFAWFMDRLLKRYIQMLVLGRLTCALAAGALMAYAVLWLLRLLSVYGHD